MRFLRAVWQWVKLLRCQHDEGLTVTNECVTCKRCGRCLEWFYE